MRQETWTMFQKLINISFHFNTINFSETDILIMKTHFQSSIKKFYKSDKSIKYLFNNQIKAILSYLLLKAFNNSKINRNDNIEFLIQSKDSITKQFNENTIIILSRLGEGSYGSVYYAYNIETEKIVALKNIKNEKLFEREKKNYERIHHPYLPRFFGTAKIETNEYLVIEYIEGFQLNEISKLKLTDIEKISIILDILFSIKSIHDQNYIYRDLKPSNIIIDSNKTAVLIDFDRTIENITEKNDIEYTVDFGHLYIAPEIVNRKSFNCKTDIYSIGLIIYFIFFEENPKDQNILSFEKFQQNYPELKKICEMCTENDPKQRPNIIQLINCFIFDFLLKYINEFNELRNNFTLRLLRIYIEAYQNDLLNNDYNKEIYYLKMLSSHNFYAAQYLLANIFKNGQYIKQNINKSIFYFSFLSNNHYLDSRNILNQIYKQNKFISSIKDQFSLFIKLVNDNYFQNISTKLKYIFKTFSFYFFTQNDKEIRNILKQQVNIEIIMIEEYEELNGEIYLFICFDYKFLILNITDINELNSFFAKNKKSQIFINSQNKIYKETWPFLIENNDKDASNIYIHNFMLYFINLLPKDFILTNFLILILRNLASYLIQKAYIITNSNRLVYSFLYFEYNLEEEKMNSEDFIVLNNLIFEENSRIFYLIYHIKKEELLVLYSNINETSENFNRKISKYKMLNHPLLPRFYGTVKLELEQEFHNKINQFFVYEFIIGHPLSHINEFNLSMNEKYDIISQIIIAIYNIHQNNCICIDLTPKNIIINQFNNAILVGLNLVEYCENMNQVQINSESIFIAPEVSTRNFNFSCDIYSIGLIIYYIIFEKTPNLDEITNKSDELEYIEYYKIIKYCINKNANERPSILELIEKIKNIKEKPIFDMFDLILDDTDDNLSYTENMRKDSEFYCSEIEYYNGINYYELCKKNPKNITNSIKILLIASNKNQIKAQYKLGKIYINNKYIKRDINKAFFYLTNAAKRNYCKAQFAIGKIYFEGKIVNKNVDKSLQYFQEAANNKFPRAIRTLGTLYYRGEYIQQNINKAISYFYYAAKANDIISQYYLGILYLNGNHINYDINNAIYYLSKAAENNYPMAQYNLGCIYINDIYHKQNISKAIDYFTKSANNNCVYAQHALGLIYGVPKYLNYNLNKAISYFLLAAKQDYGLAQTCLGSIYYEIDIKKSFYYTTLAANKNIPEAQYNLGYIYYHGKYCQRNIKKAIEYLELSAKQNYLNAKNLLGLIYYKGYDVPKDFDKAIYYFQQGIKEKNPISFYYLASVYYDIKDYVKTEYYLTLASEQNISLAQYWLGRFYYYALNHKYDINKAIYYLKLSSDNNYSEASYLLGQIYYNNVNAPIDKQKAIFYFKKAAKLNHKNAQSFLGRYYYKKKNLNDIKQGLFYYAEASNNGDIHGNFGLGYIYHEGKNVKRDIIKAVKLYKEASSFNYKFAKNNLGIIYKHGFGNEIQKNIQYAVQYFNEAISQQNDILSMYNLANIYFYDETIKIDEDYLFSLLIKSAKYSFFNSKMLLCLFLLKKFRFNVDLIKRILMERNDTSESLISEILLIIQSSNLSNIINFHQLYITLKNIDFLYKFDFSYISYSKFMEQDEILKDKTDSNKYNITPEFYNGFGNDLI